MQTATISGYDEARPYPYATGMSADMHASQRKNLSAHAALRPKESADLTLPAPVVPRRKESADVIPEALRARWYAIKHSNLPAAMFTELVVGASYAHSSLGRCEVSEDAIDDLLDFWRLVGPHAEPSLMVTPKGGVGLEWFQDPEHALAILFQGDGAAIFNVFDGDAEVDGIEPRAKFGDIVAILGAIDTKPLLWSERA